VYLVGCIIKKFVAMQHSHTNVKYIKNLTFYTQMSYIAFFPVISARKTYHKKLHVQMEFLMMNTRCSKYAEDTKN